MYAIVDIAGQQFKVEKDQKIFVHRLAGNTGDHVEFDKVLLLDKEGTIAVGTPTVDGAKVVAEILEHVKGDKVIVFKKKRRKGYAKKNGHRQFFTQVEIQAVLGKGEKFTAPAKTEKAKPKKEKVVKEEAEEVEVKETKKAATKKAAPKAEKKEAAPKKTKKSTSKKK